MALPSTATTTVFSESDFAPSDWTHVELWAEGTYSAQQQLSGGNPGSFQELGIGFTTHDAHEFVGHLLNGAFYDPATEGILESIQLQFDYKYILNDNFGEPANVQVSILLLQDGIYYTEFIRLNAGGSPTWNTTTLSFSGDDLPNKIGRWTVRPSGLGGVDSGNPNWRSGSPIQVGYLTSALSTNRPIPNNQVFGIDNYQITFTSTVPEPSTLLLYGVGLAVLRMGRLRAHWVRVMLRAWGGRPTPAGF